MSWKWNLVRVFRVIERAPLTRGSGRSLRSGRESHGGDLNARVWRPFSMLEHEFQPKVSSQKLFSSSIRVEWCAIRGLFLKNGSIFSVTQLFRADYSRIIQPRFQIKPLLPDVEKIALQTETVYSDIVMENFSRRPVKLEKNRKSGISSSGFAILEMCSIQNLFSSPRRTK